MKIDKTLAEKMSADMRKALQTVAEKYGVELTVGNGRFSDFEFNKKVSFKVKNEEGFSEKDKNNFITFAEMYGLDQKMFGKSFETHDGKIMKIVGLNTRKSKNMIQLIDTKTQKRYSAPVNYILKYVKI